MGWRELWTGRKGMAVDETRWVVLDVETTGLDPHADRLLAIAAIALSVHRPGRRLAIHAGDSFEVVLRQEDVSFDRENILLHGIGVQRQREGIPAGQALQAFAGFVGASPLLAFHSAFDQAMVTRYSALHLGGVLSNPWVDIEQLCAVTHEEADARSLDDWMAYFGVTCNQRHQAAADAMAECEVLLRIWPRIAAQCRNWREVSRLADRHRWISRR
jgi:DNA polymerase III subunit epsilon